MPIHRKCHSLISHDLSAKFMISFTISLSCPWLSSFLSHDLSAKFMISFTIPLSCPRLSSFISHDLSVKFMISFTIFLSCPWLSSFISHDLSARIMISLPRSQSPCYPSSPASRVAKRRPLPLWFSLPVHWQWIPFSLKLMHDMFVICYSLY